MAKSEREDVNISKIHPLREAVLLVAGVSGGALLLFFVFALIIEFSAPLIPPGLEYRIFSSWGATDEATLSSERLKMHERAKAVLDTLLPHWHEAPFPFRIAVEPSNEINAFALPGGTILVTTALMEHVANDEELAFAIAHELGHFANRDHLTGLGRVVGLALISMTLRATGVPAPAQTFVDHIDHAASRSIDRQQEIAADAFGLNLLTKAYGGPAGGPAFLSRFENGSDNDVWLGYLETHPAVEDRISALELQSVR